MTGGADSDINDGCDVAVIGMNGRFPGSRNLDEFWCNLRGGVESIRLFTDDELISLGVDALNVRSPGFVKAGATLDGIDLFDAGFFGYSPREAEMLDPQHRLFLESSWEALENAGYNPRTFDGLIGVFAGMSLSTYLLYNLIDNPLCAEDSFQVMIGSDKDFLSTRVSYHLNLKGPSIDVQTGCSTSLVAVHLACQSLLTYQCDVALAGGISVQVPQRTGYFYQEGGLNSPDGHCRAFDARAQGTVFGSGVGVVVMRRLSDATSARDHILAVIRGSAVNNDGAAKIGYTAPGVDGQAQVIVASQTLAGVEAETVTYLETHGTGTALGDPIEVAALTKAFRTSTEARQFCALGSVKTNVGHLDAAAGVAGLIKTVLALQNKQLPPTLHFEQPNPKIDFTNSPFYVNSTLSDWKVEGIPRRAGVSSFGIGGTNAHVIVEEAPALEPSGESRRFQLLLLSAKSSPALEAATANLVRHLKQHDDVNLADVAYTLQQGREIFSHRRMVVCGDRDDALHALEAARQRVFSVYQEATDRPAAFMFPGGGAQYVNMGSNLYQAEPFFRGQVDSCCDLLKTQLGYDLRDILYPDEKEIPRAKDLIRRTSCGLPALFVIEYAMAKLWMSWGVHPQAMIGHSLGEYVAACLAGVFSLEDALALVALRGKLFEQLPKGGMLGVPLPENQVRMLMNGKLSLAAINGPSQCVVSGPERAIMEMAESLRAAEVEFRHIQIDVAAHSEAVDRILNPFSDFVKGLRLGEPRIPFISNVTGNWVTGEVTDPDYWTRHLRQTVRFGEGVGRLLEEPDYLLLEVGPGQNLSTLAKLQTNAERAQMVIASIRHPYEVQDDVAFLLTALGRLWLAGVRIEWAAFYANERRRRVPLPTYPFERRRYWIEPRKGSRPPAAATQKGADIADWFYIPSWKRSMPPKQVDSGGLAPQSGNWLVLTDQQGIGSSLVRRLRREGRKVVGVGRGEGFSRVEHETYTINPGSRADFEALFADLRSADMMPVRIIHLWSLSPADGPPSNAEHFREAQEIGFFSLLFLAQALSKQDLVGPVQIWIVSDHLQYVESGDALYPEKTTLLAACKVIPQENELIEFCSVDIVLHRSESGWEGKVVGQLLSEFGSHCRGAGVAYRGQQRWVQTFEPARLERDALPMIPLREAGVYLITGGLGAIGFLLAEFLARQVRARLVLTGRTALPPREGWQDWLTRHGGDETSRKIRKLQAIEALGAEVLAVSADAASTRQMHRAIESARKRFGKIHGAIHAAGLAGERALVQVSQVGREHCEAQFQAKVYGLYVLEKVLEGEDVDFFLLMSSNASILGGLGSLGYAAANQFMDAFAVSRGASGGRRWISANWDGWLSAQDGRLSASFQTSLDQFAMTPEESIEAFKRVVTQATFPQVTVSTGDLAARMDLWLSQRMASEADSEGGDRVASLHPRPTLGTPYRPPSTELEEKIARIWQDLLGIEQAGIHDNFFDLGGNSLVAMRIVSRLKRDLMIDIPIVTLFEGPTVEALAQAIGQLGRKENRYEASRERGERRRERRGRGVSGSVRENLQ